MELNPKIPVILLIIGFFFVISGIPFIMIKNTFFKPVQNNTTVTPTPIIIYKNVTVMVTPTPDGKTYFAGEYQSGIRKLGRYFSWYREDVEGKKDMSGHVKIYDYRFFNSIHIFDPTDYRYYEIIPNQDNAKYLFIFVKIYLDDIAGDDVPLWLPDENHYFVMANNTVYKPVKFEKRLRIKELEETFNDNNDFRIAYYGVFNTYTRDLRYRSSAGEYAQQLYYVMGGESNAIDGYIVYYIPKEIQEKDIKIFTDMYAFGNPEWILSQ